MRENARKYELKWKRIGEYPKVVEKTSQAEMAYVTEYAKRMLPSGLGVTVGEMFNIPILKHVTETREKPYSKKKVEFYYVVCGKYKFTPEIMSPDTLDFQLMNGYFFQVDHANKECVYHGVLCTYFAEEIMFGSELDDDFMREQVDAINAAWGRKNKRSDRFSLKVIENNRKWLVENDWKHGRMVPFSFVIEKIG